MRYQKGEICAALMVITFMISAILLPLSEKLPDMIDHNIEMEKADNESKNKTVKVRLK